MDGAPGLSSCNGEVGGGAPSGRCLWGDGGEVRAQMPGGSRLEDWVWVRPPGKVGRVRGVGTP